MRLFGRTLGIVAAALTLLALMSAPTLAASPYDVLSSGDAKLYAAAFQAARAGDFDAAEIEVGKVKDRSLVGHVALIKLMHPTAYKASYEELTDWLADYGDLPGAERVYALALKRRPAGAAAPKPPPFLAISQVWDRMETMAGVAIAPLRGGDRGLAARHAYYGGDLQKAIALAPGAGQRWVAALASYRLGRMDDARGYFEQVARDEGEDVWVRAGGAFWAARVASETGDAEAVEPLLRIAAQWPWTFYGMIAERKLALAHVTGDVATLYLRPLPYAGPAACAVNEPTLVGKLIKGERRAHRAAGLTQVARPLEAALEVRAGLAAAKTDADRKAWLSLGQALNAQMTPAAAPAPLAGGPRKAPRIVAEQYPTPELYPTGGFTLNKALVYAMVRQESRFNPFAVSSAGAMGLMQVRPDAAARAAGDDQILTNPMPLFDGPTNLRIGQDHFVWLMDKLVGWDLLRAIAAYNGGPAPVIKVRKMLGEDADSLLLIESLPAPETREYVEKVAAAYWSYRRLFGLGTPTLDALATGSRTADFRMDQP